MYKTKAAILLLLFSSLALADINTDYEHILNGKAPVSTETINKMFGQYLREYKVDQRSSPADHYRATGTDRKVVFANKVAEIIKHNQKENAPYKKGLNEYSDMTENEF